MKKLKSGIYKIENIINRKIYVGRSKNINKRLGVHKSELRHQKHGNQHLQAAWNKCGETNFVCLPIEYCELELLKEREEFWIKELQTLDRGKGYNIKEEDTQGRYTEEYKKIIGEKSKIVATRQWQEMRESGKSQIVVIDLITEEKEYYSAKIDCSISFKNKNFNFVEKKFQTNTYNKTEEQIQEEFKIVKLRYDNYLKSQTKVIKSKKQKHYVDNCKFEFKSNFETLIFNSAQEAADYFNLGVPYVQDLSKLGKFTKTMFYLINNNGIINEAPTVKQLSQQNNHNLKAYKKLMEGRYKTYLGHIIHRNDVIFEVQRLG